MYRALAAASINFVFFPWSIETLDDRQFWSRLKPRFAAPIGQIWSRDRQINLFQNGVAPFLVAYVNGHPVEFSQIYTIKMTVRNLKLRRRNLPIIAVRMIPHFLTLAHLLLHTNGGYGLLRFIFSLVYWKMAAVQTFCARTAPFRGNYGSIRDVIHCQLGWNLSSWYAFRSDHLPGTLRQFKWVQSTCKN